MNNYYINKVYKDNIDKFFIPQLFTSYLRREYDIILSSSFAFYNVKELNNSLSLLTKETDNIIRKQYYAYLNSNKNSLLKEEIIIDVQSKFLISIEYYIPEGLLETDFSPMSNTIIDSEHEFDEDDIQKHNKAINYIKSNELKAKIFLYCLYENKEKCKEIFNSLISTKDIEPKLSNELNVVCSNEYGPYLSKFSTNPFTVDINLNYNDDFLEVHDKIKSVLNKKDAKGILLLAGLPGTGKTHYLRLLTQIIPEKKLLYIPPDLAHTIANPDFLGFLLKYPNSILFIEDAENIIKSRKAGGTQAVSNLLNLSDGLLADALKIQVVCTFNCDYHEIDEALRRPGRLIAHYEFKKLKKEKAQNLINKIFSDKEIIIKEDMTLAEIYNYFDKRFVADTRKTIGFNQQKIYS